MKKAKLLVITIIGLFWLFTGREVHANPYFYITGNATIPTGANQTYKIYLNTDGEDVDTVQIVANFSSTYFSQVSNSATNNGSPLFLTAPANSVPPGDPTWPTRPSPYFYNNTIVFSQGKPGGSVNAVDVFIGQFELSPLLEGNTSITLTYPLILYGGNSYTPGAMSDFNVTITGASQPTPTPPPTLTVTPTPTTAATPTPTSTSTPTPTPSGVTSTPTPTPTSSSSSSTSYDLSAGDVTFITIAPLATITPPGGSGISEAEIVEEDNSIPTPANLEPRPTFTPFPTPGPRTPGEVLAVQSIRELLIPGKSQADKTVVLINFASLTAFLVIVAILIWRLITTHRIQKYKNTHLSETITGELSALESKLNVINEKQGKEGFKQEFNESITNILEEFDKLEHGTK